MWACPGLHVGVRSSATALPSPPGSALASSRPTAAVASAPNGARKPTTITTTTTPSRLLQLFEAMVGTLSRHLQEDARRFVRQARREFEAAAKRGSSAFATP